MNPGAACGDPRAALGYLEARRRAPREAPGGGGNPAFVRGLAPPRPPKLIHWCVWAISVAGVVFYVAGVVFYVAGVAFGGQQACPGGAPGGGGKRT